jgi:hypothetical protein
MKSENKLTKKSVGSQTFMLDIAARSYPAYEKLELPKKMLRGEMSGYEILLWVVISFIVFSAAVVFLILGVIGVAQ